MRLLLIASFLVLGEAPLQVQAGGGSGYDLQAITVLAESGDPQIDQAQRIALAVLGADFNGTTHVAARQYYTNAWVRDSFAWGMIPALHSPSVAAYPTSELRYWLDRQQPDGGWRTDNRSGYFDETPMLISAVLSAYQITGDLRLVRSALPRLERGWRWLAHGFIRSSAGSNTLLYANVPPHVAADWADQIARRGYSTQLEALWYWGTRSLGLMEMLADHATRGQYYLRFAARIRFDINRLLWTNSAPYVYNHAPVAAFGHFRSWVGPRDYFELDSNYLCIVYGIVAPAQAASINRFVEQHEDYLLGLDGGSGVPARVVYGDYAPSDYAWKRGRIGKGRYQSAYWPSVGALVALGLASSGQSVEARRVLGQLSAAVVQAGDFWEWYASDGTGNGAPTFGWAARMFLVAIYGAYLGIHVSDLPAGGETLRFQQPAGTGLAGLAFHGRSLQIRIAGQGPKAQATVNGQRVQGSSVPASALCGSCSVAVDWFT